MNKTLFLIFFLLIQSFSVYAVEEKKFSYCGGNLKFFIPALFNEKIIQKQGKSYNCKYGFTLKNKKGNKKTEINIYPGSLDFDIKIDTKENMAQYERKYLRHSYAVYKNSNENGTTAVLTHYWVNENGVLKEIQKDIDFGKKDSISAYVRYTANPNNPDEVLFMNALEQLFLSMEIDW